MKEWQMIIFLFVLIGMTNSTTSIPTFVANRVYFITAEEIEWEYTPKANKTQ